MIYQENQKRLQEQTNLSKRGWQRSPAFLLPRLWQ
jgi:hypothetical protein